LVEATIKWLVISQQVTVSTNDSPMPTQIVANPILIQNNTFTLTVHYGNTMPATLIVQATDMMSFCGSIAQQLNITVPFGIAVFNVGFNQYVDVANLIDIPQIATVQLKFMQ